MVLGRLKRYVFRNKNLKIKTSIYTESKKGAPPIHAIINALCSVLTWSGFSDVIRSDGSRVILMKNPSWKSEFLGLFQTLRTDYVVVLLFPMFWASNWFYTYQFNDVNLARFDTRTRALNNTLYWLSQILGAFVFGYCLDITSFRRTVRAKGRLFPPYLSNPADLPKPPGLRSLR